MMNARWSFLAVPILAALGCSDPVPLPAQGAISVSVVKSSASCPDPGTLYEVGGPRPPSMGAPGDSVVDGSGARISCSVKGSNGGYVFSGNLQANTVAPVVVPITGTFSNGVVDATGHGTVSFGVRAPALGDYFNSSAPCTVSVIAGAVKPGSIWASFSCPSVKGVSSIDQQCEIRTSVIVFENCEQ